MENIGRSLNMRRHLRPLNIGIKPQGRNIVTPEHESDNIVPPEHGDMETPEHEGRNIVTPEHGDP